MVLYSYLDGITEGDTGSVSKLTDVCQIIRKSFKETQQASLRFVKWKLRLLNKFSLRWSKYADAQIWFWTTTRCQKRLLVLNVAEKPFLWEVLAMIMSRGQLDIFFCCWLTLSRQKIEKTQIEIHHHRHQNFDHGNWSSASIVDFEPRFAH